MNTKCFSLFLAALLLSTAAVAETTYQPFVLASVNDDSLQVRTDATISALEGAGFTIAGQYAPLGDANVLVVTHPDLLAIAAESDKGGYAAGQRVSIAERDGKTEVSFVNPLYLQYAYRLGADLQGIRDQLEAALGSVTDFGAEKSMTAKKLGKYHYKPLMERFDDPYELGSFDSHDAAVTAVENGLAAEGDALSLVYRIDIPGKEQVVFGVGMRATGNDESEQDIDEAHQLSIVNFEGHSKVAYFPYEILVDGSDVEALHMRFRMAVHFPDLGMIGKHSFFTLKASPGATSDALEALVAAD